MASMAMTAVVAAGLAASAAQGAIVSVGGQCVQQFVPPPTAVFGTFTGPQAWAWDEQQNRGVSGLPVDLSTNPSASNGTPVPGVISGVVDSHFIHFNDFGGPINGSVTFNNPIIGVAYNNNFLDVSDAAVGWFGTVYPTGDPWRGINSLPPGGSIVSISGNTIQFHLMVLAGAPDFDQIRVYTLTPAPGSLALLGAGGLLAGRRRRR